MAKDTFSGQLRELGFNDLDKFKPLIKRHRDQARFGTWGTYWSTRIVQVREESDFTVVLFEQHTWSNEGGGIGMLTFVEVICEGKIYTAPAESFRDQFEPRKDKLHRAFDEIVSASRDGEKFVVRLRCRGSKSQTDTVATYSF